MAATAARWSVRQLRRDQRGGGSGRGRIARGPRGAAQFPEDALHGRLGRLETGSRDLDPATGSLAPLAVPGDHADLQGEQLIEGQPSQGRPSRAGVGRVVRALQGVADAGQRAALTRGPVAQQVRGQVLRVVAPDARRGRHASPGAAPRG